MHGDLDDDFPLNGASDKLAKLFEENALPDISFKFSVPKHPSARPKPLQNNVPLKVQTGKTVEAFQLKVGGYKSEGKVGLAIIGNDEYCYYQLYMYRSDEKKVASVEINFNFSFLIQDHNYASFKDSHNIQWSVHFDKPHDIISFSKQVALARWRSSKGSQTKLVQEAFKGKTDLVAKKTDSLCVSYKISSLSPENTVGEEVTTKKLTASGSSNCWETNLIGACVKSKRFVIIPSLLCTPTGISVPDGFHLLLEMEVEDIIPPQQQQQPLHKPQQSIANMELPSQPSLTLNTSSQCSADKKEEGEGVFGRIARIGYQLPSLQSTESESNTSLPEQTKPVISTKPVLTSVSDSPNPSTFSKEDTSISFTDPSDITTTSQFNILFSEVRTSNSEIRMNINRVTDKVDSLISKMDYAPQMNNKVIPAIEKFQNMDGVLNKLVDQNNTILQLLERNSPSKIESLVNEVMQLKKRNAELESVVEISKSTCQILKGKVVELNEKITEMNIERNSMENVICSNCHGSGDKKIKCLEATVKNLQERNYSLIQATEHLESKNRKLSKQCGPNNDLLLLQTKLAEKESKIDQLEKELNTYLLGKKLDICNDTRDKSIKCVNKLLKGESNDFMENVEMDETLWKLLQETVKDYVQEKNNSNNRSGLFQENEGRKGSGERTQEESVNECSKTKTLFSPFSTPLPVPRPRRPIPAEAATLSVGSDTCKLIESKESLSKSESSTVDCLTGVSDSNSFLSNESRQQSSDKKELILPPKQNLFNNIAIESNVNNDESVCKKVESLSTETPNTSTMDLEVLDVSQCNSNLTKDDQEHSDFYDSYFSSHYTPFLRTTPPPITDD